MVKYRQVRFPADAYEKLLDKQLKMQGILQVITRKQHIRIPLTKVLIAVTETPNDMKDDYLLNLWRKKR